MKKALIVLITACMMLMPVSGFAENWSPSGTIKLQVGFAAGGSTDILGRLIAARVEEDTGWNIIVENKPGGGGVAMLSTLIGQKPDGLTLGLCVNVPILISLALRGETLPFKINSFDYIGTITKAENALVARVDAPFDNFVEFLDYVKKQGSVAVGYDANPQQMVLNAVSNQAGVKFKQIGHKSGAEQIQNLLGGHIVLACLSGEHIKYLESGDLKMIGVYNKERHAHAPEVKTLLEDGYDYYIDPYYYIAAPKGLPDNVKTTLAQVFDNAINSEKVAESLSDTLKAKPHNLGPEETRKMLTDGENDIKFLIEAAK
ncbi:MAG: tripartite tricarboxylate transporter substrate binding protein [Desulfotignum sp.]|nr:tripartite tricarboxylate transporter substrate binding protein [Desulfotignum sp.]